MAGKTARRLRGLALGFGLVALVAAACLGGRGPQQPQVPAGGVTAVKLGVDADGLVEVTAAELAAAGFNLNAGPREEVTLTVGWQPVDIEWAGDAIRFQGLGLSRDSYTPRNVYWLRRGAAADGATPVQPVPQPTATPVNASGFITATVRLEQDLQYDPLAVNAADRWYWQTLFAPTKAEISFDAPGVQAAPGRLQIALIAKSAAQMDPDHHLLVFLNDSFVADAAWDGAVPHSIDTAIPVGVLKEKENQLVIQAPGDTGAAADSVELHLVEIAYARDAADAAAEAAQPAKPASIEAVKANPLPDLAGGADLVIVTAPQFHDALKPLIEARTKQGLRVAMLDVEQVYDAFSYGRVDPQAIQSLMRYAAKHWPAPAPRYLLLAGDASYDVLGRTKGVEKDIVPTHDVYTTFSGWTGSDVWYALPDDGETTMPSLAVGRFPGQTVEQMTAMVQKTLRYEAQTGDLAWRANALLVADNDEGAFADEAQAFADGLAGYGAQVETVQGDGANAKAALQEAFGAGTGLVGYFGHGSVTLWAQEKVFDVGEAGKLANQDRLPIVFTVTCLSGYFEHPATPSLGETLLRNANGGAVAALVPSSAAVLPDQRLLAQGLAAALSQPGTRTLGEIVHEAQLSLPQPSGGGRGGGRNGVREILLTFNLLGDPTLQVRR